MLPTVYLQPALLIVCNGHPFIAPITRRNGIAVSPTRRCRIQTDLPLNAPAGRKRKGGDVPGQVEAVGARGCKQGSARSARASRRRRGTVSSGRERRAG